MFICVCLCVCEQQVRVARTAASAIRDAAGPRRQLFAQPSLRVRREHTDGHTNRYCLIILYGVAAGRRERQAPLLVQDPLRMFQLHRLLFSDPVTAPWLRRLRRHLACHVRCATPYLVLFYLGRVLLWYLKHVYVCA